MTTETPPAQQGGGDPETAALAIKFLQSQFDVATAAYDNLDRKAAILPPFLAGAAGLLLGSDTVTVEQAILLVPAFLTGATAGWYAIKALRTRKVAAGPDPHDVHAAIDEPLARFSKELASVIADAIKARRDALFPKAKAFNRAMYFAGVTLLLVAGARLIGGLDVTDSQDPQATPAASTSPAPSVSAAPVPTETPSPATPSAASNPASSDTGQPAAQPLMAMGWEAKAFSEDSGTIVTPKTTVTFTVAVEVATEAPREAAPPPADKPQVSDEG